MLVGKLENRVEQDLKWKKVEDIPDFPFRNYEEAKAKIRSGEFSTGIDFSTSNQFAQWLYGGVYTFFFLTLASMPFIVAVLSVILAVWFQNYWLLFAIPLGFLAQFTSNPYNPAKGFFNLVVGVLFLIFVWRLLAGGETGPLLMAAYIFPFWINRYIYNHNQKKLGEVAMSSEKIFIFLYQNGKMGFKAPSGQSYWHHEAIL